MSAVDLSPYYAKVVDDPLRDVFAGPRRPHPPQGSAAVTEAELPGAWQALLDQPRSRPGTAYVHIPFCAGHCVFCAFYQNPWRPSKGPAYVDHLLAQVEATRGRGVLRGPPLRALYFGGGTPTALAAKDISRLVRGLRAALPLAPDCEITLEGRAHDLTEDKMHAAMDAGVNRVSLGVQTFDTEVRHRLGRRARQEELLETLTRLVTADFGAVVIDLIYGLPGQTMASWQEDLRTVIELGLDGVDLYSLSLIPGTPLLGIIEQGKAPAIDRSALGGFYAEGFTTLERAGWEAISTTHWRSPSYRERSVYNFEAKTGADFLAFGSGAGGRLGGTSFRIVPELETYAQRVERDECLAANMTRAADSADLVNALRSGLERARLDPARVEATPRGHEVMDLITPLLDQWSQAGLLERRHRFFELTVAGRFWQVQMTQRLIKLIEAHFASTGAPRSEA